MTEPGNSARNSRATLDFPIPKAPLMRMNIGAYTVAQAAHDATGSEA
jgi:hypothetical protein